MEVPQFKVEPFATDNVAKVVPNDMFPVIVCCSSSPLRKLNVPAAVGLNVNIAPEATAIFPLIACPGVAVMLMFTVPDVTVKLSITTALVPLIEEVPDPANSMLE